MPPYGPQWDAERDREKGRVSGERNHCNQGHRPHFVASSKISNINSILFHYMLI